jgi:uncharacterized protein (TIGR03437 family)
VTRPAVRAPAGHGPANPVQRGSLITLYATGEGETYPPGVDGKPGASPLPTPVLPVQLTIGGALAEIRSVGGALGEVAGLLVIEAYVPATISVGRHPVHLCFGKATSQEGVFVTVG